MPATLTSATLFPKPGTMFTVNRVVDSLRRIAEAAYGVKARLKGTPPAGAAGNDPFLKARMAVQYAAAICGHPKNPRARFGDWSPQLIIGQEVYVPTLDEVRAHFEKLKQKQGASDASIKIATRALAELKTPLPKQAAQLSGRYQLVGELFKQVAALEKHLGSQTEQLKQWNRVLAAGEILHRWAVCKTELECPTGQTWEQTIDRKKWNIDQYDSGHRFTNEDIRKAHRGVAAFKALREKLAEGIIESLKSEGATVHSEIGFQLGCLLEAEGPSSTARVLGWLGDAFQTLGKTDKGKVYVRERALKAFLRVTEVSQGTPVQGFNEHDALIAKVLKVVGDIGPYANKLLGVFDGIVSVYSTLTGFATVKNKGLFFEKRKLERLKDSLNTFFSWARVKIKLGFGGLKSFDDAKLKRIIRSPRLRALYGVSRQVAADTLAARQELKILDGRTVLKEEIAGVTVVEAPSRWKRWSIRLEAALTVINAASAIRQVLEGDRSKRAENLLALAKSSSQILGAVFKLSEAQEKAVLAANKATKKEAEAALQVYKKAAAVLGVVNALIDCVSATIQYFEAMGIGKHKALFGLLATSLGAISAGVAVAEVLGATICFPLTAVLFLGAAFFAFFEFFWDYFCENETTAQMRLKLAALEQLLKQTPWYIGDRSKIPFRPTVRFAKRPSRTGEMAVWMVMETLYPYQSFSEIVAAFPALDLKSSPPRCFYGSLVCRYSSEDAIKEMGVVCSDPVWESGRKVGNMLGSPLIVDLRKTGEGSASVNLVQHGVMEGMLPRFALRPRAGESLPATPLAFEGRVYASYTHQQHLFMHHQIDQQLGASARWLKTAQGASAPFQPLACTVVEGRQPPEARKARWEAQQPKIAFEKSGAQLKLKITEIPRFSIGKTIAVKLFDNDPVSGDDEIKIHDSQGAEVRNYWPLEVAGYRDARKREYGRVEIDDLARWRYLGWKGWDGECAELYPAIYELFSASDTPQEADLVYKNRDRFWKAPIRKDNSIDVARFDTTPPAYYMTLRKLGTKVILRICNIPTSYVGQKLRVKFFDYDTGGSDDEIKQKGYGDNSAWERTVQKGGRFEISNIASYEYINWFSSVFNIQNESEIDLYIRVYDSANTELWNSKANGKQTWKLGMKTGSEGTKTRIDTVKVG